MAHDSRALLPGTYLCGSAECLAVLVTAGRTAQHTVQLLVRSHHDVVVVTARYAAEHLHRTGGLKGILNLPEDRIRYIAVMNGAVLPPPRTRLSVAQLEQCSVLLNEVTTLRS